MQQQVSSYIAIPNKSRRAKFHNNRLKSIVFITTIQDYYTILNGLWKDTPIGCPSTNKKYSNELGLLYIAILIYLNIFEVWVWGISPPKECQFLQLFRVAKVIGYVQSITLDRIHKRITTSKKLMKPALHTLKAKKTQRFLCLYLVKI